MPIFDKLLAQFLKPWVFISYLLLIILSFLYLDKPIAEYFNSILTGNLFFYISEFTHVGHWYIYFICFLVLALFFRYIYKNSLAEARCWFLWLSVFFAYAVCGALKMLLGRARPGMWLHEKIYGFYGYNLNHNFWSFPSGHATTIMAVTFALAILFPHYGLWFIIFGVLAAISRILLHMHFLSDILATILLTLMEIAFLRFVLRKLGVLKIQ